MKKQVCFAELEHEVSCKAETFDLEWIGSREQKDRRMLVLIWRFGGTQPPKQRKRIQGLDRRVE